MMVSMRRGARQKVVAGAAVALLFAGASALARPARVSAASSWRDANSA
jgi:hypothetical protein